MVNDARATYVRACILGHMAALQQLDDELDQASMLRHVFPGIQKTLLHVACWWGRIDCAQFLIERGADIAVKDKKVCGCVCVRACVRACVCALLCSIRVYCPAHYIDFVVQYK